jgi:hypothetical protein
MCIVMCNKVHRQLCWYIDAMNIVFTFLYGVFYNCHHTLGSHSDVGEKTSAWSLFVMFLNCLYMKTKQTAIISFMQCEMLIIDVSCFI